MSKNRKSTTNEEDEVEQLLRAAQDDMLLKLTLNSHIAHSSTAIDPDLDRRFLALKKPNQASTTTTTTTTKVNKINTDQAATEDGDDLFARFTALKSSIPSNSRSSNLGNNEGCSVNKHISLEEDGNNNEEDEVDKLIKWAIDAARLDPSSPSDDDEDYLSDDNDDEDDYETAKNRKKDKKK